MSVKIKISTDYSDSPGGRYISEGAFSGEEFREDILIPKYLEAKKNGMKLEIDLDGCFGYPSSFIDEAFGGLARNQKSHRVLDIISFTSNDQPDLIDRIKTCVHDAKIEE